VREEIGRTEGRPVGISRVMLMSILWLPNLLFIGLLPSINTPSSIPSSLLLSSSLQEVLQYPSLVPTKGSIG